MKPRNASSNKGDHGHSLIIAGSKGKMGAAVIAAKACLRTGTGLLTVLIPQEERAILQIAIPEAMLQFREANNNNFAHYSAIGIGPAIGLDKDNTLFLQQLFTNINRPLVLDADALTILASERTLISTIPKGSIITPHPKEFDRVFGVYQNDEERRKAAIQHAIDLQIVIVLKGQHTLITYAGEYYVNSTGNSGLAKGGSGDALTGMITAFLSQGYNPFTAAKLGVYMHGLAADIALQKQSVESMLITDVIECIGLAFKAIES